MSLWSRIERRLGDLADDLMLDEHRDQVGQARALISSGQHGQAIELLRALLVAKPDHGHALMALGSALLEAKDPALRDVAGATAAFEKALAVRPGDPTALLGLGLVQVQAGAFTSAIASLQRAVLEAGGNRGILAEAYRGLGIAWRRLGDYDKSIRELRKAVAEAGGNRDARAALAEAIARDGGSTDDATRQLDRAMSLDGIGHGEQIDIPAIAYVAQGLLALRGQAHSAARDAFGQACRLSEADTTPLGKLLRIDALLGQGDAALGLGDYLAANQSFLLALALDSKQPTIHGKLAAVHAAVGNRDAALASFDVALGLLGERRDADAVTILAAATDAAIVFGDAPRLGSWSADLLVRDPDNVRAIVARGLGLAAAGDALAAQTMLELGTRRGDIDAHIGLAALADTPTAALAHLGTALRLSPKHPRALRALTDTLRAGLPTPANNQIATLGQALEKTLASRADLAPLVGGVARAIAALDQPLLVTVMGEFSSGKSSFVNAFIGADVAPTGITPTTATINVIRYGHQRIGRVFFTASSEPRELAWDELFAYLRKLDAHTASTIDRVEILVPLPQLEKINIVDTPGLNSILPEHEATARAFIARADAVVWLFTANQGGKASERKALASIHGEGKRVLGVLNKADQLSASEVTEVIDFISQSLGDLVLAVVPVSARAALAAKATDAPDAQWLELERTLEERFFSQARRLKSEACARRLRAVIAEAKATLVPEEQRAAALAAQANSHAQQIRDLARTLGPWLISERKAIIDESNDLFRRAAREVIELVRPRRMPFAAHSATIADRDYVVSLLTAGYEASLDGSRRRLAAFLRQQIDMVVATVAPLSTLLNANVATDLEDLASSQLAAASSAIYQRALAYLRGFLDGGYVETFFQKDVPRLELNEDAVYHALFRNAPDIDRHIGEPLEHELHRIFQALAGRVAYWSDSAALQAQMLELGLLRALDDLEGRLQGLRE